MDPILQQLSSRVSQQLPALINQLTQEGYDAAGIPWQLECSLTPVGSGVQARGNRIPVAAVDLGQDLTPYSPAATPVSNDHGAHPNGINTLARLEHAVYDSSLASGARSGTVTPASTYDQSNARPSKRRKTAVNGASKDPFMLTAGPTSSMDLTQNQENGPVTSTQRKKRASDNPVHQPSSVQKYINGVWESLYSGPKIDMTEVVEQWQAIESDGQPKLLTDVEQEVALQQDTGVCKYNLCFSFQL